jgi:hypothetical protein
MGRHLDVLKQQLIQGQLVLQAVGPDTALHRGRDQLWGRHLIQHEECYAADTCLNIPTVQIKRDTMYNNKEFQQDLKQQDKNPNQTIPRWLSHTDLLKD